jgi:glycosyltransferase involved in cell wall biosynthesis
MHIVLVDTLLTDPPPGGPHIFLSRLVAALEAEGFRISVISQAGKDHSCVEEVARQGVPVYTDKWRYMHLPEDRARRLAAWVNHEQPEIYVISNSQDTGWLTLPLLKSSIATMAIAHANVEAYYAPLRHYGEFVDCAVGVSRQIREEIVRVGNIPAERASYVPYGVPTLSRDEFESDRAKKSGRQPLQLVYLGRIVQSQKRVLDLVPLAVELVRRNVDFHLDLIGEGQEKSTLANAFEQSGLNNRVRFWGWLNSDQVRDRLRQLDVILLPSDSEGLPIAMLEAMGHGIVPVVSDIKSGMIEVIRDGTNGYVAPVGDSRTFADRLQVLAADRARLMQMSDAAWTSSQEYSIERMAQNYISLFHQMADRRRFEQPRINTPTHFRVMPSCQSRYPNWIRKMKQHGLAVKGRLEGNRDI